MNIRKNIDYSEMQAYLKLKAKEQRAILEYLRTLPTHLELIVNGGCFYLVHGFPAENVHDEVWFRPAMNASNPKPGYHFVKYIFPYKTVKYLKCSRDTYLTYTLDINCEKLKLRCTLFLFMNI